MSGLIAKAPVSDNWLGTNSGRRIMLAQPAVGQIDLNDLAEGLSKVCRFNGQIKQWYCVAEHCIHVAELVPDEFKLRALIHDAPEAYLCDIPTPLKRELGRAYTDIEERVAMVIATAFGLDPNAINDLPEQVSQADTIMAVTERDFLQAVPQRWPDKYEKALRYPKFKVRYNTPDEAKAAWLKAVADQGITYLPRNNRGYNPMDNLGYNGADGPVTQMWYDELSSPAVGYEVGTEDPGEAAENW